MINMRKQFMTKFKAKLWIICGLNYLSKLFIFFNFTNNKLSLLRLASKTHCKMHLHFIKKIATITHVQHFVN